MASVDVIDPCFRDELDRTVPTSFLLDSENLYRNLELAKNYENTLTENT